jgi:hypothetical protein
MATVHLGRSEREFWRMTPRKLRTMIAEWNKVERYKSKVLGITIAAYMNGKNPDDYLEAKPVKRIIKESREQLVRNARNYF